MGSITISKTSVKESKHVIKVLRKKEGDLLDFTDGNGNHQIGEVLKVNNNEVNVLIKRIIKKKKLHKYELNIYIAPTKNSKRFEWFLEKSTQMLWRGHHKKKKTFGKTKKGEEENETSWKCGNSSKCIFISTEVK